LEVHLRATTWGSPTLTLGVYVKKLKIVGGLAAICALAFSASANSVPTRTRSSYGDAGSLILQTAETVTDGVTIDSQSFCSDANTNTAAGTCQVGFSFQIQGALPAGTTSLSITLPIPAGTTLDPNTLAGILTNDSSATTPNVPFSPNLSAADVLSLGTLGAINFSQAPGKVVLSFTSGFAFSTQGTELALFLDLTDNSTASGNFCYKGSLCTPDVPDLKLVTPVADVNGSIVPTPEPASILMLGSGLLGLVGFGRRRRANS
jgi:PEP-CTERM motif